MTGSGFEAGVWDPGTVFQAHAGPLNEGGASTVYVYVEFRDPARAEELMAWMADQEHLSGLFRHSSHPDKPVGEVRMEGSVVFAEGVVADEAVPDLFSGD